MNIGVTRVSLRMLPSTPRRCPIDGGCVYKVDGICDNPSINKGNGDALCHRLSNRFMLKALGAAAPSVGET